MKINSLYVHIPFCNSICAYCDFPKVQYFAIFVKPYLEKLKEELCSYPYKDYETIYVGGGTPTSLNYEEMIYLLEMLKPYSDKVKEYTFEANPESLTLDKIKLLKSYGVNRLSIGVQTLNDDILKCTNRKHSKQDVILVINNAIKEGIDNINVDLILGLPGTNKEIISNDLDFLLSLPIKHLSTYSLSINPHSEFYIKKIEAPNDDILREYYDLVHARMLEHGFIHYEVSNFSQPNYQSKHNFTYWRDQMYVGIGMGASSYVGNKRYKNTSSITEYIKGNYNREIEDVSLKDDLTYYVMLNLRTNEGIDLDQFKRKFDIDLLKTKKEEINNFIDNNLLVTKNNHLIATYEGMMVLDNIIIKFI